MTFCKPKFDWFGANVSNWANFVSRLTNLSSQALLSVKVQTSSNSARFGRYGWLFCLDIGCFGQSWSNRWVGVGGQEGFRCQRLAHVDQLRIAGSLTERRYCCCCCSYPSHPPLSALLECFVWGCMVPMVALCGLRQRERPGWQLILLAARGETATRPKPNPHSNSPSPNYSFCTVSFKPFEAE